jgi:hypothetical protein
MDQAVSLVDQFVAKPHRFHNIINRTIAFMRSATPLVPEKTYEAPANAPLVVMDSSSDIEYDNEITVSNENDGIEDISDFDDDRSSIVSQEI